jgi:L-alanine-DL-glutamate epimerase-like enolase superfamily enzyme
MLAHVFKSGHAGSVFGSIATADMAVWDLKAKAADEPLWRTLGGRDRYVPAYASGLDIAVDDEELALLYGRYAERGFAGGKLKGGLDLDADLRRLEIMRDALAASGVEPALMFDANESWYPAQAVRYLHALEEEFDLTWVEEPVRRWDAQGLATVRRSVRTAVATGENLSGLEQYRPLLDADAIDIVQSSGVWGITHFLRVAIAAHSRDLPVSPVGYNTNPLAHAAVAIPNHLSTELQNLNQPFGLGVDQTFEDGGIVLGDAPGLGITVDEGAIAGSEVLAAWTQEGGPHVRPARAGLRLNLPPREGDRN